MKKSHVLTICTTLLLIGLVNALVIWAGINKFNRIFDFKSFTSSSSSPSIPPNVAVLSPNRFVIVEGDHISVYSIDALGKLKRTDNVNTSYRDLVPRTLSIPNPAYPPG